MLVLLFYSTCRAARTTDLDGEARERTKCTWYGDINPSRAAMTLFSVLTQWHFFRLLWLFSLFVMRTAEPRAGARDPLDAQRRVREPPAEFFAARAREAAGVHEEEEERSDAHAERVPARQVRVLPSCSIYCSTERLIFTRRCVCTNLIVCSFRFVIAPLEDDANTPFWDMEALTECTLYLLFSIRYAMRL